jgi:hypothetical protein
MANVEQMEISISRCLYRKKNTFELCHRCAKKNSLFCRYHNYSTTKDVYKIYYELFKDKSLISQNDIYKLYTHIYDTIVIIDYTENVQGELFKKILHHIPFSILKKASTRYIKNRTYSKEEIYDILYKLNKNTYDININYNSYKTYYTYNRFDIVKKYQEKIRYNLLIRKDNEAVYINDEDLFSCEKICDIPKKHLFSFKENIGAYAFDVIELEYFVKNCYNEGVEPYNPYTREKLSENVLWKLKMFIINNNITTRNKEYKWDSNIRAFTDLSITIERNGFYNNPEWFNKMKTSDILKTIKYFKDFSSNIQESNDFFCDINANTLVFDFCREAIKMFNECKDDLYILCCNFIKALSLCSNDFYENLPAWLLGTETPSMVSNFMSIFDRNNLDVLIDNNMNSNIDINYTNATNNFLLYYYVEYM